jgi:hypothetical protein
LRRISRGEVADIRERILSKQGGRCAICGARCKGTAKGGATLDHCHDTGVIRGVLCRVCNGGEGKIKNLAIRYGGGKENWKEWLHSMLGYLGFHKVPQTVYLHPTWETEEEKRLSRNKKARVLRKKKKEDNDDSM